jgi:hypothetical protein
MPSRISEIRESLQSRGADIRDFPRLSALANFDASELGIFPMRKARGPCAILRWRVGFARFDNLGMIREIVSCFGECRS